MKLTKILSLILCVLAVYTSVLSACNSSNNNSDKSSADEVSVITTTQQSTTVTEAVTTAASTGEETVPATEKETKTKETTPPAQDKDDSDIDSNAGPVDSQEPEPMTCTVTVSDRDYTFNLGDRFTYTCYLKTPDKIEDIQAQVNYTGRCLKLISTEAEDVLPLIGDYAICNTDNPGIVKYNATRYKGIDFKKETTLITLEFEVIFGGYASVSNAIEIMTGIDGIAYAESYIFSDGVKTRETIG